MVTSIPPGTGHNPFLGEMKNMIPVDNLKSLKRHYEAVQRLMLSRMADLLELVELSDDKKLSEKDFKELQTLYSLVAPMNLLSEDINAVVMWLLALESKSSFNENEGENNQ